MPVTAATAGSAVANNPAKSDIIDPSVTKPTTVSQTDPTAPNRAVVNQTMVNPTAPDQTAADQTVAIQIAPDQTVTNQTSPAVADPAAPVETVPDKTAALAAAQALAAARGTENGTADLKLKAKLRAPDDVRPSGEKSKPTTSDKTAPSDKTGTEKTAGVTTADTAAGLKNSPIQPLQDGQTQDGQAPNNASPSASAPQAAPTAQPDGHAAAAKADASAAQAVSASPLASEPPKIVADLQVVAGHDGTDTSATLDKLGVTIAAKSLQGLHQFDIRLDPPDLGRVQVKLTVDDAGQAQASLVVDKPQTLDLLQRDSSSLNRVLTDAGLNLSNNGLSFSLRDQQQQTDGGTNKGRSRNLSVKAALAADSSTIRSTSGSYAPNSVRLDIRV
jgi:flagellar hook-length control protein FliK